MSIFKPEDFVKLDSSQEYDGKFAVAEEVAAIANAIIQKWLDKYAEEQLQGGCSTGKVCSDCDCGKAERLKANEAE